MTQTTLAAASDTGVICFEGWWSMSSSFLVDAGSRYDAYTKPTSTRGYGISRVRNAPKVSQYSLRKKVTASESEQLDGITGHPAEGEMIRNEAGHRNYTATHWEVQPDWAYG